jgi:hypothetical protein
MGWSPVRAGDLVRVDQHGDDHGLRRRKLFRRVLESRIQPSRKDEPSHKPRILESLSNHVQPKGLEPSERRQKVPVGTEE